MTKKKPFKVSYDPKKKSVPSFAGGESKTQQQFKKDTDIYSILRKHTAGVPIKTNPLTPIYTDVSDVDPFTHHEKIQDLQNQVIDKNQKLEEKIKQEEMKKRQNTQKEQTDENENKFKKDSTKSQTSKQESDNNENS